MALPTSPLAPDQAAAQLPLELALAHTLLMKAVGQADRLLDGSALAPVSPAGLRAGDAARGLANLTARLMNRTCRGTVLLMRLPSEFRVAGAAPTPPAPIAAQPAAPKLHAIPGQARGRLNNGNPAGDFLAAPRCGARTRAGCSCRQPAMANGRCRFHGGKSTGPRTAEGLARSRSARLVHGGRTRTVITLRSAGAHSARRLTRLIRVLTPRPAGHGVDRLDSARKVHHRAHRDHRGSVSTPARAARSHPSSVVSVPSVVNLSPAGHGLHRSESVSPTPSTGRRARLLAGITAPPAFPAGYGVHRSVCA